MLVLCLRVQAYHCAAHASVAPHPQNQLKAKDTDVTSQPKCQRNAVHNESDNLLMVESGNRLRVEISYQRECEKN